MRKDATESERIRSVLCGDRLNISKEYISLVTYDLAAVLSDYLELDSPLSLNITPGKTGYQFTLSGSATRLKPVNTVPKND